MIDNKYFNYLIFFLFFGLWSSVGSDPYDFLFIFEKENNIDSIIAKITLKNLINFFRSLFPIFCLVVSTFIIFKYKFYNKQKKFIYILLLIQIIQIVSTYLSNYTIMSNLEDSIDHIGRYHWIISSIASLLIFMIASKTKNFDINKLFLISVFFLILIVLFFSIKNIYDFFYMDIRTSLYNLNVYRESAYFLNHQIPRVTGVSRSIIFLYVIFFFININLNNKYKYFLYIILVFFGAFIFLYQSKYSVVSYILINILFYINSKNKLKISKIILILFITQLLLFFGASNSRILINKIDTNFFSINETENKVETQERIKHFRKFGHEGKEGLDYADHVILSGRGYIWEKSLKIIKERPLLGFGSMSDRIIMNQIQISEFQVINPVSNAFIYSVFSGGIFSLFLFIYFWISIRDKLFNIFSIQNISNNLNKIGVALLFLIGLRCIIENSVMLFGVDYLLLLNALYLTETK